MSSKAGRLSEDKTTLTYWQKPFGLGLRKKLIFQIKIKINFYKLYHEFQKSSC